MDNQQRILRDVELHTDTLKVTLQRFIEFLHLLGVVIGGVWVKLFQHSADASLHQFVLIHVIDVEAGDSALGHDELTHLAHVNLNALRKDGECTQKEGKE